MTEAREQAENKDRGRTNTGGAGETARLTKPLRGTSELEPTGASRFPLTTLRRFLGEVDRFFLGDRVAVPLWSRWPGDDWLGKRRWSPRIDVIERQGQLVLRADLPGLRTEDIRVHLDEDMLTISGEKRQEFEQTEKGVHRSERSHGMFQRGIALPQRVDPESVQATFDNGVLEVKMPLPTVPYARGRQIPIRGGGDGGMRH